MMNAVLPLYNRAKILFCYGKGMYLYTKSGEKYLDFASGYAANSFGHAHPKLVEALKTQIDKVWHLSNRFDIIGLQEYSQNLVKNTFADTVYIANTGAEAVESCIKFARRYHQYIGNHKRFRIITIEGAFHGRTLACTTASSGDKISGFGPPVNGFDRVGFNDLDAIKEAITNETAAVLVEPIQGEGGMRPFAIDFFKKLRRICDRNDILLILDEVQSGAGRTGALFAYEKYGVEPDLLAAAKGIGGGFPVSACLMKEKIGQSIATGTHGSTFGGNPLAISVASKVLEMLLEDGFLSNVNKTGDYLLSQLNILRKKYSDIITDVRGMGLMLGIQIRPDLDIYQITSELCNKYHMLTIPASDNILRLTPALIVENAHCDEAISSLDKLFATL